MIWADLHCHTRASDGSMEASSLIRLAKERGLSGLSITDHDTIGAYAEAVKVAQDLGIHLGVGVEFSAVFEGHDVHLLGYDFDLNSTAIEALCQRHQNRRANRNSQILENLRSLGMEITDLLQQEGKGTIGRPHIAQAMVLKGYVSSVKEAFRLYLGEGKKCYAQGEKISVDETIEVIHAAHGKAFIAHPHLLPSSFPLDLLLQRPFDGIECYYGNFGERAAARWLEIAHKKGWLISGGSDFHGLIKPQISLGSQGVTEATFYQIFEHALT